MPSRTQGTTPFHAVPDRRRRAVLAVACFLGLLGLAPGRARAACGISETAGITATASSVTIPWLVACSGGVPLAPPVIDLVRGGTGPTFQNGQVLGRVTGNGRGRNAGTVSSNLATLAASTNYTNLRVCGIDGGTVYCSGAFNAATTAAGPPLGSNPSLTGLHASYDAGRGTITFGWNASSAYTTYVARIEPGADGRQQQVSGGSASWDGIAPGTTYTLSVEGGVYEGVGGNSWSGKWASIAYATPAPPPAAPLPPTNVQAVYQPPGSQATDAGSIRVSWTDPPQGAVMETVQRTPGWPAGAVVSQSGTVRSLLDTQIAGGMTYQYRICLQNAGGTVCAQPSVTVPLAGPHCQLTLICPPLQGVPPQIRYTCDMPTDFYEAGSEGIGNATRVVGDSPTTYTGVDQFANPRTLLACRQGGRTSCTAILEMMSATGCALPPVQPTPVLKNCQECSDSGRQCVRVTGGFRCKGTAQ